VLAFLAGRVRYQWWIVVGLLVLAGSPAAVAVGSRIAAPWGDFVPQVIGVLLAWTLSIPAALLYRHYAD